MYDSLYLKRTSKLVCIISFVITSSTVFRCSFRLGTRDVTGTPSAERSAEHPIPRTLQIDAVQARNSTLVIRAIDWFCVDFRLRISS